MANYVIGNDPIQITLANAYVLTLTETVTTAGTLSVPTDKIDKVLTVDGVDESEEEVATVVAALTVEQVVVFTTTDADLIAEHDTRELWNTGLNAVSGEPAIVEGQVGPVLVKNHIAQVPVYGSRNLYVKLAPGDSLTFSTTNHNEVLYYAGLKGLSDLLDVTVPIEAAAEADDGEGE